MKERPILFTDEMVRAILDGRKTQTRRIIKHQPKHLYDVRYDGLDDDDSSVHYFELLRQDGTGSEIYEPYRCPYGAIGDRLWVREAWMAGDTSMQIHECDPPHYVWYRATESLHDVEGKRLLGPTLPFHKKWKPSIYMPRWASRITLQITNVRVERVQGISSLDAFSEGAAEPTGRHGHYPAPWATAVPGPKSYRESFQKLWDSINAKRGHSWESNPWVWVVEFKRLEQ